MANIFSLRIKKNEVIKTINTAGILAIILGAFSLLIYLIFSATNNGVPFGASLSSLIWGVSIFFILGLGVCLRNRVFAVGLIIYFIIDRISSIVLLTISGNMVGVMSTLIFGVFFMVVFLRGAKAIFVYHKHIKKK